MDRTILFSREIQKAFMENRKKLKAEDLATLKKVAEKLKSGELTLREVTNFKSASKFNEDIEKVLIEAYNKALRNT